MQEKCLSIVIPVYNEERTIHLILDRIKKVELIDDMIMELIIVNDCSTDRTAEAVRRYMGENPDMSIQFFEHSVNKGKGAAAVGSFLPAKAGITYDLLAKASGGRSGALGPLLSGVRGVDLAVGHSCDLPVQVVGSNGEPRGQIGVGVLCTRSPHHPVESHPASLPDPADAKFMMSKLSFTDDAGLVQVPAPGIEASWLVVDALITRTGESTEEFLPLGNSCTEPSREAPPLRLVLRDSHGDVIVQLDPCDRRGVASHVRCTGVGDAELRGPKHGPATYAEFDLTANEQHRLQLRADMYLLFFDVDGVFTGSRWIVVTPGDVYPVLLPVCVNGR